MKNTKYTIAIIDLEKQREEGDFILRLNFDTPATKVGNINRCYIAGADDKDWKTVQVLIVSDEKPSVDDRIVVTATNSEKLHIGRILRVDEIRDNKLVCGMFVMETKED